MIQILVTASVLILLLAALRFALRGRISLRLQYALWLLAAVRLLVPVTFGSSPLSILNAAPSMELAYVQFTGDLGSAASAEPNVSSAPGTGEGAGSSQAEGGTDASRWESAGTADPGLTVLPQAPSEGDLPANTTVFPLSRLLMGVWAAGMAVMTVWLLAVNRAFRVRLRRSAQRLDRPDVPLPVYVSDAIPSPCLSGLFRPAIYLTPECLEDEGRLRHVLAHEYTHYRHGDHLWALVRCLCLTIYWFHPLVWWAASLSRRDCELACDEGALARLGEGERTAYGRTLISLTVARTRPADLLEAATTMTAGRSGLKERVLLIAKRPKMLAVTAAAVVLLCVLAVACTFTGADTPDAPATLEEALAQLPDELADSVTVSPGNGDGYPERLASFFHTATYEGSIPSPSSIYQEAMASMGWICDLYRYDQADFEATFLSSRDNSGLTCFAKDDSWYYALQVPTDVQWDESTREDYETAYTDCVAWVLDTVLNWEGMEPFSQEDYLPGDYTYEGAHYDVKYYPYLHVTGDTSVVYTLVLSQPAAQGEGGIWCVERWYDDNGTPYLARPDTDQTAAEFYASLQNQADAGTASYALDPLSICMAFAQNSLGHSYVHEDNFDLGEPYEGERTEEITVIPAEQAVLPTLEAIAGGETVTMTLAFPDGTEGGGTYTVPSDTANNPFRFPEGLTTTLNWSRLYGAQPPACDWTLTYWAADGNHSLTVYGREDNAGSGCTIRMGSDGVATWYYVSVPPESSALPNAAQSFRNWYDEIEVAVLQSQVTVTEGEAGWPENQSEVPGYVARTLSQRTWEVYCQLSPGSRYALDETAVLSAQVYDMDDLTDPSSIAFNLTMASRGGNMNQDVWQAGAGSSLIEEGDYAGWWDHWRQVVAQRTDGVWRITDWGTGGYRAAGRDGLDFQPDILTCSDNDLMAFLLDTADGAWAENGQYQLGQRLLDRPEQVLEALATFRDVPAERFPDYSGDGEQWLAELLVSEFVTFRGGADNDAFLAALDAGLNSGNEDVSQAATVVMYYYIDQTYL